METHDWGHAGQSSNQQPTVAGVIPGQRTRQLSQLKLQICEPIITDGCFTFLRRSIALHGDG